MILWSYHERVIKGKSRESDCVIINFSLAAIGMIHLKATGKRVGLTSGGFDPFGPHHARLLEECKNHCDILYVLVNGDEFLIEKKGYTFMPVDDRLIIIDSIKGVDFTFPYYDGTQFIASAIKYLKPNVLLKGGDRNPDTMALCEVDACKQTGTQIIYGVGGTQKVHSSSWYIDNLLKNRRKRFEAEYQCKWPA